MPLKMVAYALGLPLPTVSTRLASAASKIGLATRMELVRIAAMLAHDPRARFERTSLTIAERDVLELLAQGLTNKQIATLRGRSIRTIANQVASLLAKTKAPSRRTLVAAAAPRLTV
jgi:DNA-binding NarL/FixJ family response regulator